MTGGKLRGVKHFDSKAEVELYIRSLPLLSAFYMPAFYMQNMTIMFKPKPTPDGNTFHFSNTWSPTTTIPLISITDTGKFIAPILTNPEKYAGKVFTAATAYYTPLEMVDAWTKVTGKKVEFVQLPHGTSRSTSLSPEMRQSLQESTGLIKDYSYYGPTGREDLEWSLAQVGEKLTSWEEFVRENEPWFD